MPNHPQQLNLAELLVDRIDGTVIRGTGYVVTAGWVMTSDHNVSDATRVRVWLGAPSRLNPEDTAVIPLELILHAPLADLALVPVPMALPTHVRSNVVFGRLDRGSAETVPVVAAGFPRFKLRAAPDDPAVLIREVRFATGTIAVGSNIKTGTLEFGVENSPADVDPKHSPWEGMSGAALFASGRLIGVVGQHHPTESTGVLTVRPVTSLFDSDTGDLDRWREILPQLGTAVDDITVVSTPSQRELTIRRAQRAATALSPRVLVAREDELALLTSFVRSTRHFMWLQGDAFAGKTALLAWFALHQPVDVDIAACFLRRTTASADARYAFDVLCEQLAVHAGDSTYDRPNHPSQQREMFLELLEEAAATSAERGHRLLLLVDGADEYQANEPGLDIGTWLPDIDTAPDNAWLLVASRAGIRIELPPDHALMSNVHYIGASPAAREIERIAEKELAQARRNRTELIYQLLGLLAAAQSGLTCRALAELAQRLGQPLVTEVQVLDILQSDFSRSILQIPDPRGIEPTVLVFAHLTLLDTARKLYAGDLPRLNLNVIQWADDYAARHWPPDTPSYLLLVYPQLLRELNDTERLYGLATDTTRADCLHERTEGDASALAEITGTLQFLADQPIPDLARICLLARARDNLAHRNRTIPDQLLGAWIRLGHVDRAVTAAESKRSEASTAVLHDARAKALAHISRTLAEIGDVDHAVRVAETMDADFDRWDALVEIAEAAAEGGDIDRATATADAIADDRGRTSALSKIAGLVAASGDVDRALEVSGRMRDGTSLAEALKTVAWEVAMRSDNDRALTIAGGITDRQDQERALTEIAYVAALNGDLDEAARIAYTIADELVRAAALARIAPIAARAGDIDLALRLADGAERVAHSYNRDSSNLSGQVLCEVAAVVALTGDVDRAEVTASVVTDEFWRERALAGVVESVAQSGDFGRAQRIAGTIANEHQRALALQQISCEAAASGDIDLAEAIADTITNIVYHNHALGAVARSGGRAGYIDRAEEFAHGIVATDEQADVLGDLAEIAAQADDIERAQRLAHEALELLSDGEDDAPSATALRIASALANSYGIDNLETLATTLTGAGRQAEVLSVAADVAAQAGYIERAARLADAALERLSDAHAAVTDHGDTLGVIARSVADAGDTDGAEVIAEMISDEFSRAVTLTEIAKIVSGHDPDRALSLAEGAERFVDNLEEASRAMVLTAVAEMAAVGGQVARGLNIAGRVERLAGGIVDDAQQAEVLSAVAEALADLGAVERALAITDRLEHLARNIVDDARRDEVLMMIVVVVAKAGDIDSAERILITITQHPHHDIAMKVVAEIVARSGELDRAVAIAQSIEDEHWLSEALTTVAMTAVENGATDRARAIAHSMTDGSEQNDILTEIAKVLARDGDIDGAVKIAHTIADGRSLSGIARSIAGGGDVQRAVEVARAITDEDDREWTLGAIAGVIANADDIDGAVELGRQVGLLAEQVDPAERRNWVAQVMARTDYASEDEDFVNRALSDGTRFVRVAARLAVNGDYQWAATMLALTWIESKWDAPLEVLGTVDLRAAHKVAQELSTD